MVGSEAYSGYKFTIGAGDSIVVHAVGRYVTCLEANIDFEIGIGSDASQFMAQGLTVEMAPGEIFDKITLDNAGGASALVVRVGIGTGNLRDQRLTLTGSIDVSTGAVLDTVADVSCANLAVTQVLPLNVVRRRAFVQNLDATATVRVGDGNVAAARGLRLGPGDSITIETTEAISLRNDSGAAVLVAVMEEAG